MSTELERPKAPLSLVVAGVSVVVIVGFLMSRMIIGFVITLTKIGVTVAIIAAIVALIARATGDDS